MWKSDLPRPKGYEDYTFPFVVKKPWGWERWLELWQDPSTGKGYCMKHIFMRKGIRTSFQRHNLKTETNFLTEGEYVGFFENELGGEIEEKIMQAEDPKTNVWTIPAGRAHRIHTLTDIHIVETSTYEVDDVTRLGDDYGRGDGKIDSEHK